MKLSQATSELQISEPNVRVTLWRFPPASQTGWHVHEVPYVIVPVIGGVLTLEIPDGKSDYTIVTGSSYARPAGANHNIINATDAEIAFAEVEMLYPAISD